MACTKACERSGLLDVADEVKIELGRQNRQQNGPFSVSRCLCLLGVTAAIAFFVYAFITDPFSSMTPEGQVALLNSETERAMPIYVDLSSGCKATVILMRHCEYNEDEVQAQDDSLDNGHCSDIGLRRSEYIPTLFGNESSAIWPLPKLLYAMSTGRRGGDSVSSLENETLAPLKAKAGVEINMGFSEGSERRLAKDYFHHLAQGELCHETTVINWRYKRIPTLAMALGCGPEEGCPEKYKKNEFDKVWQLKYTFGDKKDESVFGWTIKGKVVKERFIPQE